MALQGTVVVINAHSMQCDALIVTQGDITILSLPKLKLNDIEDFKEKFIEATKNYIDVYFDNGK